MNELPFEEHYFKNSKISNYRDYTERKYVQQFGDLVALGIEREHYIVDFGCATGALVKEFIKNGYTHIIGTDVSYWAINYGRTTYELNKSQLQYLNYGLLEEGVDWIVALDVFEHLGDEELHGVLGLIRCKNLVMRVPVCATEGEPYVLEVSKNDKTHVQCHCKEWWLDLLGRFGILDTFISAESIYDSPGVLAAKFNWRLM